MSKNIFFRLIAVAAMMGVVGCSTAPRRQEVHPVETVEQTPSAPAVDPAEVERMRQQLNDQQAALAQSEAEKRALEDKLNSALASKTPSTKKSEDSYLK